MLSRMKLSSSRGSLNPQQKLQIALSHLENASKAKDPVIAKAMCHDAEVSLSQARKAVKKPKEHAALIQEIATAYIDLGKLLESLNHVSEAQAIFKKAKKLG